jgi:hypothetical protein
MVWRDATDQSTIQTVRPSTEIPAVRAELAQRGREVLQMSCDQVAHFTLSLPDTLHQQQLGMPQWGALSLPDVFPANDLHGTGFVF